MYCCIYLELLKWAQIFVTATLHTFSPTAGGKISRGTTDVVTNKLFDSPYSSAWHTQTILMQIETKNKHK